MWSVLRAKQLCGLKFRRQHPIEPWIADFACPQKMLVVEIDGGYHDNVVDADLKRQKQLEALVARTIARELNVPYEFKLRTAIWPVP